MTKDHRSKVVLGACGCHAPLCKQCRMCSKCKCHCSLRTVLVRSSRPAVGSLKEESNESSDSSTLSTAQYATAVMGAIYGGAEECPVSSYIDRLPPSQSDRLRSFTEWSPRQQTATLKVVAEFTTGFAQRICPNGWQALTVALAEKRGVRPVESETARLIDKFVSWLLRNRRRTERRIGRALLLCLCKGVVREAIRRGKEVLEPKITVCHRTLECAREDIRLLESGQPLSSGGHICYDTNVADAAVEHVLSSHCVRRVSWSTKNIATPEGIAEVAGLMRTGTISDLWRSYEALHPERDDRIGRSMFFRLCRALTIPSAGAVRSLNYIYFDCVVYVLQTCRDVVDSFATLPAQREERRSLCTMLELATASLKCAANPDASLCTSPETCTVHNLKYALGLDAGSSDRNSFVQCRMVRNLFAVLDAVTDLVRASEKDEEEKCRALAVVNRNKRRWAFYIGHAVRWAHQSKVISALMEEIADDESVGYCVLDYKMKLEPMMHSEDQRGCYGKKGMSLHGVALRHRGKWHYFTHVVDNSSAQDVSMTTSIVEAFLHLLRGHQQFDCIRTLILQSDQARNYSSQKLLFCIACLNRINSGSGIPHISRFLHTEVQQGHGIVDSFFSAVGATLRRAVDGGRDVVNPTDAVEVLQEAVEKGALRNVSAEKLTINRDRMDAIVHLPVRREPGTAMDTHFFRSERSFGFLMHSFAGDDGKYMSLSEMITKNVKAKRKDSKEWKVELAPQLPEAVQTRGLLPLSGACRHGFRPFSHPDGLQSTGAVTATEEATPRPKSCKIKSGCLLGYCISKGVHVIKQSEGTLYTRANCHRLLDEVLKGKGLVDVAEAGELTMAMAAEEQEEYAHSLQTGDKLPMPGDPTSSNEDTDSCDGDADSVPCRLGHEDDDDETELLESEEEQGPPTEYEPGWARRRHAAQKDGKKYDISPLTPEIKTKLRDYYAQAKGKDHIQPGKAIQQLQEEGIRKFELPSWTQVHTYMCQVHATKKDE